MQRLTCWSFLHPIKNFKSIDDLTKHCVLPCNHMQMNVLCPVCVVS